MKPGCPVCGDFAREPLSSGLHRAYGALALDEARFLERDGFTLFCPVAPLVVGYLMVAPTRHDEEVLLRNPTPELLGVVDSVLTSLERRYGAAWSFEHASTSSDGTSCVPHAHIHILPGTPPLRLFESASVIGVAPDEPADVYVRTRRASVGLEVSPRRRQHVRIILSAETQGRIGWDWRLHRNESIYKDTCRVLEDMTTELVGFVEASEGGDLEARWTEN